MHRAERHLLAIELDVHQQAAALLDLARERDVLHADDAVLGEDEVALLVEGAARVALERGLEVEAFAQVRRLVEEAAEPPDLVQADDVRIRLAHHRGDPGVAHPAVFALGRGGCCTS